MTVGSYRSRFKSIAIARDGFRSIACDIRHRWWLRHDQNCCFGAMVGGSRTRTDSRTIMKESKVDGEGGGGENDHRARLEGEGNRAGEGADAIIPSITHPFPITHGVHQEA